MNDCSLIYYTKMTDLYENMSVIVGYVVSTCSITGTQLQDTKIQTTWKNAHITEDTTGNHTSTLIATLARPTYLTFTPVYNGGNAPARSPLPPALCQVSWLSQHTIDSVAAEQRLIYDKITNHFHCGGRQVPLNADGRAGTGKSFIV